MTTSPEVEYAAAQHGAVVYNSRALGRLRLTGDDRCDFLHRMSTNDINALEPGQGAATILTTPTARIVDRVIVYQRAADLLLLTSPGAQSAVAAWLRKHIFFNDDVQVHDASSEWSIFSLYGGGAGRIAARIAGQDLAGLGLHGWVQTADSALIARADPIAGEGFHLLAAEDVLNSLWQAAIDAGATPVGESTMELLRIESGLPRYGVELSQEYIPLEVGLLADISFNKGCYTGQEIIARMDTRQRLAKKMVRLRSNEPIEPGGEIRVDGSSVGKVTSAAVRPDGGGVALGFIKTPHAVAGKIVAIHAPQPAAGIDGHAQLASVSPLDSSVDADLLSENRFGAL
jgi:aminomethyltransferase